MYEHQMKFNYKCQPLSQLKIARGVTEFGCQGAQPLFTGECVCVCVGGGGWGWGAKNWGEGGYPLINSSDLIHLLTVLW